MLRCVPMQQHKIKMKNGMARLKTVSDSWDTAGYQADEPMKGDNGSTGRLKISKAQRKT